MGTRGLDRSLGQTHTDAVESFSRRGSGGKSGAWRFDPVPVVLPDPKTGLGKQ